MARRTKPVKVLINGTWVTERPHKFDVRLAETLKREFEGLSVVDFGCGWQKLYARHIGSDGYDGNPNTLDGDVLDISQPFDLKRTWDVVMCLEVLEHIPKMFEETTLDNLVCHSTDRIVISWAGLDQKGRGHVNCQSEQYVIDRMNDRGCHVLPQQTRVIRQGSSFDWFRRNILVFQRGDWDSVSMMEM